MPPGNKPHTLTHEEAKQIDNEALRLLCAAQRNTIAQLRASLDKVRLEVDMLLAQHGEQPRYGCSKGEKFGGR